MLEIDSKSQRKKWPIAFDWIIRSVHQCDWSLLSFSLAIKKNNSPNWCQIDIEFFQWSKILNWYHFKISRFEILRIKGYAIIIILKLNKTVIGEIIGGAIYLRQLANKSKFKYIEFFTLIKVIELILTSKTFRHRININFFTD